MMYASDPHESESETERELQTETAAMTAMVGAMRSNGNNIIMEEYKDKPAVRGDKEESTISVKSLECQTIKETPAKENKTGKLNRERSVSPKPVSIHRTSSKLYSDPNGSLYSDPMVREAAARKKRRSELEAKKALNEQKQHQQQPTTFKAVATALQEKYEQMLRQYKYDPAINGDSEAARYGYRFGSSEHKGDSFVQKYGPYYNASSIRSSNTGGSGGGARNGRRSTRSTEENNRWLLQVIWMGLTMTLMMMMVMSASENMNGLRGNSVEKPPVPALAENNETMVDDDFIRSGDEETTKAYDEEIAFASLNQPHSPHDENEQIAFASLNQGKHTAQTHSGVDDSTEETLESLDEKIETLEKQIHSELGEDGENNDQSTSSDEDLETFESEIDAISASLHQKDKHEEEDSRSQTSHHHHHHRHKTDSKVPPPPPPPEDDHDDDDDDDDDDNEKQDDDSEDAT